MAANFTYKEAQVTATALGADTFAEIIEQLSKAAQDGLLSTLSITDAGEDTKIVFRYKTDSTEKTLTYTDYLVKLTAGNYTVMSASDFEAAYGA